MRAELEAVSSPLPAAIPKPLRRLSVVMPAYNEEEVLPVALAEAVFALERIAGEWELLVVDDGSTDRTPEILARWSGTEPRIRVLTQSPNQGYAKALIRGFGETRFEAVFYTDADAQFDLGGIARLAPMLEDHDMVAGYRVGRRDHWLRLVASWVYNLTQALVLGTPVNDVNCAFKLFRRSFFDRVRLSSDGFLIDAELYARSRRAGLKVARVGVAHRPRAAGSSSVRTSTITATLWELWRLRRSLGS